MVGIQVATPITGQKKYYVYELAYPESNRNVLRVHAFLS